MIVPPIMDAYREYYGTKFAAILSGMSFVSAVITGVMIHFLEFGVLPAPSSVQIHFYSPQVKHAPAVSVAVLDELLTALHFGTPDQHHPDDLIVENARSSVENYLETLHSAFVDPADQPPPALELHLFRKLGFPLSLTKSSPTPLILKTTAGGSYWGWSNRTFASGQTVTMNNDPSFIYVHTRL